MATLKTCFKCRYIRPLCFFYRHSMMRDGHLNKCIACAKADVIKHRLKNLNRVQAYDRSRAMQLHRIAARVEYLKTERGREIIRRSTLKYQAAHPDRRRAHITLGNAIRDGKVVPWPVCAVPECDCRPQAHHPDYSRPLDVVWLCPAHHRQTHLITA